MFFPGPVIVIKQTLFYPVRVTLFKGHLLFYAQTTWTMTERRSKLEHKKGDTMITCILFHCNKQNGQLF